MDDILDFYAELHADGERGLLSVRFLGFTPHAAFVNILEGEYDLVRELGLHYAIIDLRLVPVYATGSVEYVRDTWFPTVAALGMERVAFVVPDAVLGQMSMNVAHSDTASAGHLSVEHFRDYDSALGWLGST